MDRDKKGCIGWSILALILGIIVLPFMIGREVYQYLKYPYNGFEWFDVGQYGILIGVFSVFHWFIIDMCNLPLILAL